MGDEPTCPAGQSAGVAAALDRRRPGASRGHRAGRGSVTTPVGAAGKRGLRPGTISARAGCSVCTWMPPPRSADRCRMGRQAREISWRTSDLGREPVYQELSSCPPSGLPGQPPVTEPFGLLVAKKLHRHATDRRQPRSSPGGVSPNPRQRDQPPGEARGRCWRRPAPGRRQRLCLRARASSSNVHKLTEKRIVGSLAKEFEFAYLAPEVIEPVEIIYREGNSSEVIIMEKVRF